MVLMGGGTCLDGFIRTRKGSYDRLSGSNHLQKHKERESCKDLAASSVYGQRVIR